MMYERTYTDLHATALSPEAHTQTCGYWYTVRHGATAHTAFLTRAGLDRWLDERNLWLARGLPNDHTYGASRIIGTYRERSYLHDADLSAQRPIIATAVMSNGDYTLGLITQDKDGVRTVHYLNPNAKTRVVFDHLPTRELMS